MGLLLPTVHLARAESVEETLAKAESGDVKAQCSLGVWYHFGIFVETDFEKAVKWYRRASDQGSGNAQFGLGVLYARGNGVEKDETEACKWFILSAIQGNKDAVPERERLANKLPPGQYKEAKKRAVAFIVHKEDNQRTETEVAAVRAPRRDPDEDEDVPPPPPRKTAPVARKSPKDEDAEPPPPRRSPPPETPVETARDESSPKYQKSLPEEASPRDTARDDSLRPPPRGAGPIVMPALPAELGPVVARAEQGDVEAQKSLGQRFETGSGTAQNYALAARWYRRAADQGDVWAQISLGSLYVEGHGVPRDYVEAFKWIAIAVDHGGTWFGNNGRNFVGDMTPEQIDEAKARAVAFQPRKEVAK